MPNCSLIRTLALAVVLASFSMSLVRAQEPCGTCEATALPVGFTVVTAQVPCASQGAAPQVTIIATPLEDGKCFDESGNCVPDSGCKVRIIATWTLGSCQGFMSKSFQGYVGGVLVARFYQKDTVNLTGSCDQDIDLVCDSNIDWQVTVVVTETTPNTVITNERFLACSECQ